MKLRTRITVLCSAVLLITLLCTDAVLLYVTSTTMLSEAEQKGLVEAYEVFEVAHSQMSHGLGPLRFYIKNRDEQNAVFLYVNEKNPHSSVYNSTGFSYEELSEGLVVPQNIDPFGVDAEVYTKRIPHEGGYLLVSRKLIYEHMALEVFHITELAPTYNQIQTVTVVVLVASLTIALFAIWTIHLLVKKSMDPLGKLADLARDLADGQYDQRIKIIREDEVGRISREFNKMADAVQQHTADLETELERKQRFMGNLTHELKTPLTAISGYAQTM